MYFIKLNIIYKYMYKYKAWMSKFLSDVTKRNGCHLQFYKTGGST